MLQVLKIGLIARMTHFRAWSNIYARISEFDRIATIRFPLALSLLFLHNDRGSDFSGRMLASPELAEIVRVVSVGIGGFRLPTFFLISGYLFFRSVSPTIGWFVSKIASRGRSLLLPLIAWNALGLLVLSVAQQIPALASFLNAASAWSTPVAEFSTSQVIAAIFGDFHAQPLIYPLWFLHDLFVLVLFTPIVYAAISATRGAATVAVALVWLAGYSNPLVAPDALVFFFIGCHVAIARRTLFALDSLGPVAAIVWLTLQVVSAEQVFGPLGHPLRAVSGVIAVLALSGALAQRRRLVAWAKRAEPFGYFLFFAHEPLLTITRKASLKLLHLQSPTALLIAYFAVILVVVTALLGLFMLAKRACPAALAFMTGGRASGALPARHAAAVPALDAPGELRSEFNRFL